MKIDITREPPADIFRHRSKYRLINSVALTLSGCGLLLAAYTIVSDTPHSDNLEMTAFTLFVGPILVFSYFGEKLQAYKRLSPGQEKELTEMGRQHPEIKTYCAQVAMAGRQPTLAEFEACLAWAEDAREVRQKQEG